MLHGSATTPPLMLPYLQLIVTFFHFLCHHLHFALPPAWRDNVTWHCHHTNTHAATPLVKCYHFSIFFCHPLCAAPVCCNNATQQWLPCHHSCSRTSVDCYLFSRATSTLHCPLPAATMSHGSATMPPQLTQPAPPIDFYLFSFFATMSTLCCHQPAMTMLHGSATT